MLEVGPHQFQVIGLYCFLIGFSPVVMYLLYRQHTRWIIFLSWSLYALNAWLDIKITHARFELGFPILSWQLLFFNGMVIGFHHNKVFDFLADSRQRKVVFGAAIIAVLFLVFAAYNPEPLFWPWDTLNYFSVTTYKEIYMMWFQKSRLGFGRVLNNIVVYMSLFAFISYYWQICYRWLGGFLIPIGQSSLYVFVWHVFFVLFWSNTPVPGYHNIWLNTLIHVSSIALIWLMVKKKFLFSIVPR